MSIISYKSEINTIQNLGIFLYSIDKKERIEKAGNHYADVEISNNIAERAVKPFVINKKVFMTSGPYAEVRYTTILFSIIRTAGINDLHVENYLTYILDNIDNLLPYSEKLPNELKYK